jgi:hypothetical protein
MNYSIDCILCFFFLFILSNVPLYRLFISSFFPFGFKATDRGGKFSHTIVEVLITPGPNRAGPMFPTELYDVKVSEGAAPGTTVLSLNVSLISHADFGYTVVDLPISDHFFFVVFFFFRPTIQRMTECPTQLSRETIGAISASAGTLVIYWSTATWTGNRCPDIPWYELQIYESVKRS